jgi:hypothetical protein
MNLFEVIIDLSKALDINLFNDKHFTHFTIAGLLTGLPKHCNLYWVISRIYEQNIPKWFANKYNDVDKELYKNYIEE